MSEATPRINAQYLDHFNHQTVRIVGKVRQIRGETATIEANGSITLHLNKVRDDIAEEGRTHAYDTYQDCHLQNNHAFEIIGRVQQDLSVKVLASTDFGPESNIGTALTNRREGPEKMLLLTRIADFNAIDAVVDATHRHHEIFYPKNE